MDLGALIHVNETVFYSNRHCSCISVNHTVAVCKESLLWCVSMQHKSPWGPGLKLPLLWNTHTSRVCESASFKAAKSCAHSSNIHQTEEEHSGRALSSGRRRADTCCLLFRLHEYSKVKVREYLKHTNKQEMACCTPSWGDTRWNDALNVSSVMIVGFYDRDMDRSAANLSLNPSRVEKRWSSVSMTRNCD